MFERIIEVFLDALKDSAITLPILFICYLLIEFLEEKLLHTYKSSKVLRSRIAPIFSAGIGLIPQCGFSVVASDLYSKKVITIGSLFAIFIATSDEALVVMLSVPNRYLDLILMLGIKFVYAVFIGLIIDLIFTKKNKKDEQLYLNQHSNSIVKNNFNNHNHHHNNKEVHSKNLSVNNNKVDIIISDSENKNNNFKEDKNNKKTYILNNKQNVNNTEKNEVENTKNISNIEENVEDIINIDNENLNGCCKHHLGHESNRIKEIFIHPLKHSLIIFTYIFIINLVFGFIVEFVGKDVIQNFLYGTGVFQPFIASLVGLIPNCAASVIITKTFIAGGISLGSCIAGLCVNSGLAIVMLFKMNKNMKENILILISLYTLSCLLGLVINLF